MKTTTTIDVMRPSELKWAERQIDCVTGLKSVWLDSNADLADCCGGATSRVYLMANRDPILLKSLCELCLAEDVNVPVPVVLGDWWQGAFRTAALPTPLRGTYWYDVRSLLPLSCHTKDRQSVLLISNDAEHRRTFSSLTETFSAFGLAVSWEAQLPTGKFDYLLVDLDDVGTRDRNDSSKQLTRWRSAYPSAAITILLGFPRWNQVEPFLLDDAVGVSAKPYNMATILCDKLQPSIK